MINETVWNIINAEVYREGTNRLMGEAKITLPEINFLTTDIKGNGIAGEYSVSTRGHTENLESTLTFRVVRHDAVQFLKQDTSHNLNCYAAYESHDSATGVRKMNQLRVDLRGVTKSLNMGEWEPGEVNETELVLTLNYLRLSENGKELLLIDKFNYVFKTDDVDYLAAVRKALAL